MAAVFKTLVESGTNGSVKVQPSPTASSARTPKCCSRSRPALSTPGIPISVGGFASVYPMIGVLDVPFAFPNISVTYEVFDGLFGDKLAADIEAKTGLHVLGFGYPGGFYDFTNSKSQIRSPADMEGLKIRTQGLDTHKTLVQLPRRPAGRHRLGRGLHRVADRRRRRPDEPGADHRLRQVRRGPEVPDPQRAPVLPLRLGDEPGDLRRPHRRGALVGLRRPLGDRRRPRHRPRHRASDRGLRRSRRPWRSTP